MPQRKPATAYRNAAPGFIRRVPLRLRPLESARLADTGTGARRHDRTRHANRQPDAHHGGDRQAVPEADRAGDSTECSEFGTIQESTLDEPWQFTRYQGTHHSLTNYPHTSRC